MLHTPAHAAAYCLDPEFRAHAKKLSEDVEVLQGLYETLRRLSPDEEAAQRARQQWSDYQLGTGRFARSNTEMWNAARTMQPHVWWYEYCNGAPELRAIAMRVLSMPLSAGSIERAWSSFDFIHNRKRNRLTVARADALVSIFSNMKLVRRAAQQAAAGQHHDAIPWTWTVMEEDEELPEETAEEEAAQDGIIDVASGPGSDDCYSF